MKKRLCIMSIIFMFVFANMIILSNSKKNTLDGSIEIEDIFGRKEAFKTMPKRVVLIGPGSARLFFYIMGSKAYDYLVGIDSNDLKENNRPYILAYREIIDDLKPVGSGAPSFSPDLEIIISLKPDLIIASTGGNLEILKKMREKLSIPVIGIDDGYFDKNNLKFINPKMEKSLHIIAKIFSKEERSNELITFINNLEDDLKNRTNNISSDETVYIGGLGFKGPQGIFSTTTKYYNFDLLNLKNVVNDSEKKSIIIDKEKLLSYNPDIIFIDNSFFNNVILPYYKKNYEYFNNLKAFKTHKVYLIASQNDYGLNLTAAYSNSYYMGNIVYPNNFKDIDLEEKIGEIYKTFIGVDISKKIFSNHSFGEFNFID